MRKEEIEGTQDLIKYVKLELVRQTQKKKTLILELPDRLYFKLMKLVIFCLKDKEENARKEIDEKSIKFIVRINGTFSIITRKN